MSETRCIFSLSVIKNFQVWYVYGNPEHDRTRASLSINSHREADPALTAGHRLASINE